MEDALIVVVDRDGQRYLRPVLPDDILIKTGLYLHGLRQLFKNKRKPVKSVHRGRAGRAFINYACAHAHALVAYITAVAGNKAVDRGLRPAAK